MISFSWPSPGLQQHCKPHYYKVAMASVDRQSKFLRIGFVRVKMKYLDSGFTLPTREARYSLKKLPGHSASLPLVRMSYRGFLVYMEYKMWLEPKVSMQSSRMHTTPCASWNRSVTGCLRVSICAALGCLLATCDHGTFAMWPMQLRGFILNSFKFKWKKTQCLFQWMEKKPSCFQ